MSLEPAGTPELLGCAIAFFLPVAVLAVLARGLIYVDWPRTVTVNRQPRPARPAWRVVILPGSIAEVLG